MKRKYWKGKVITELKPNEVFVFGSNPQGRHGMGAAKTALNFGAKYGKGRGLAGKTYALVTKNLQVGYREDATGIVYNKKGLRSVPLQRIKDNIIELYEVAKQQPNRNFLVTYQKFSKNLNGYSADEIMNLFFSLEIPKNIIFHESFKDWKPKIFKVVIAGGRDFKRLKYLTVTMDAVLRVKSKTHKIVIISGMAKGADTTGIMYAKMRDYEVLKYPADWENLGKSAGFVRNEQMCKEADAVVCFWNGVSKGTKHMIDITKGYKKPLRVIRYE